MGKERETAGRLPRLKIAGSGSDGNCYVVETSGDMLVVELGVRFRDILKTINYAEGMKKVRGCLASHL